MIESGSLRSPDTFGAFYDETLPGIYGYFLRRCGGSAEIAEDLTSETFVRAVAQLKRSPDIDEPVRWLFGIARHTLIDHYRSQFRASGPHVLLDERAEQIADQRDEFSDVLDRDRAISALEHLSADQRMVMVLRYLEDFRVSDIAAVSGKSEHAIESLLARGRAAFKRAYREDHDE